ncbi:hypothetical protein LXL04_026126 [Taraxacum kok-saghyz]
MDEKGDEVPEDMKIFKRSRKLEEAVVRIRHREVNSDETNGETQNDGGCTRHLPILKLALWSCGSEMTPGLDGNIEKYWTVVQEDFLGALNTCHVELYTFTMVKYHIELLDYRPISLKGIRKQNSIGPRHQKTNTHIHSKGADVEPHQHASFTFNKSETLRTRNGVG